MKKNNNLDFNNEKSSNSIIQETITWILTILSSFFVLVIFILIGKQSYNPSVEEYKNIANEILIIPETVFPEPKEKILYLFSLFLVGSSLFFFYYLYKKNKYTSKKLKNIFNVLVYGSVILVFYVIYRSLVSENPFFEFPQNAHDLISKTNGDFYFIKTFIYKNYLLYFSLIVPLIVIFFTNSLKINPVNFIKLNKRFRFISLFISLIIITIVCGISTIEFPFTFENKYDFNTIYYSVIQVYNNQTMLVDSFTSTYGLYSHFLVPLFKIIGLSMYNFSFIMGILLSICFLIMYYYLAKYINNKIVLLLGFTSIFYNSYMYFRVVTNFDTAFATSPIRWIFPCIFLLFSTFYLSVFFKRKNYFLFKSRILINDLIYFSSIKLISFLFFPLGILWAPDTGMFTVIVLILFYCYLEFDRQYMLKSFIRSFFNFLFSLIGIIIIFEIYLIVIKNNYEVEPKLALMFSTIKVFSSLGLGMLPLPDKWHIWMIVISVYAFGILNSVSAIINRNITEKSAAIFVLSIFGILFFTYYQGRSHNWNLLIINFPVFILLSIFTDILVSLVKINKTFVAPLYLTTAIIGFSFFQIVYDAKKILELLDENKNKALNSKENNLLKSNASIIDSICLEGEKIFILSAVQYQSLYHSLSNTASAINPAFSELFTKDDYNIMLQKLIKKDMKIFFEPNLFRFNDMKIIAILGSLYNVEKEFDRGSQLWYLSKKTDFQQKNIKILKNQKMKLIHELLSNNNVASQYALGLRGGLKVDSIFNIEVVFQPKSLTKNIYCEGATILSNLDSNKGFLIKENDKISNNYLFIMNNQIIDFSIIENHYNYIVFQIKSNEVSVFVNGIKIKQVGLTKKYINSSLPLFVGNLNNQRGFFFGNIEEIQISNGLIDEIIIKENLELLRKKYFIKN